MIIRAFLGKSVKDYLDKYGGGSPSFPYTCPIYGVCRPDKHGHFDRTAIDTTFDVELPIYRFLYKAHQKTISLLPSFLWPHRSYLTGLVEMAVTLRVEEGLSWHQLIKGYATVLIFNCSRSPSMAERRRFLLAYLGGLMAY